MWLTQGLQEVGVSGLKVFLVQQAEESTGHVDHVLDVEEQAVQVGWRRLRKKKRKSTMHVSVRAANQCFTFKHTANTLL